jgi:hypothetical protein
MARPVDALLDAVDPPEAERFVHRLRIVRPPFPE